MSWDTNWLSILENAFQNSGRVSTDTRRIQDGSIFFALKGPNFDGNQYALQALNKGASLAVVDDPQFDIPGKTLLVQNSLEALQALANSYRKELGIEVIVIGGSNGKTTTKGLVASVLNQEYRVHSTPGNFNNHIGLPLSILSCPADAEKMILEMGANHKGEHTDLLKIAEPDIILITNIGKDHLEGFGGEEGVIEATKEFFDYANKRTIPVFHSDQKEFDLNFQNREFFWIES